MCWRNRLSPRPRHQSWDETELFDLCRRAMPYRDLTRASFDAVVKMLAEGFVTSRGRGRAISTMIASTITSGAPWRQTRGHHLRRRHS